MKTTTETKAQAFPEIFQVRRMETTNIQPAPLSPALVPGMELTIPSADVDRKFLVSAGVSYACADNMVTAFLLKNGDPVSGDLGAAAGAGSITVAAVVVDVEAGIEAVLQVRWRATPGERARLARNNNFVLGVGGRHLCAVQVG